jgi:hypothetical protein
MSNINITQNTIPHHKSGIELTQMEAKMNHTTNLLMGNTNSSGTAWTSRQPNDLLENEDTLYDDA